MLKAIIFDLDGVIVSTDTLHKKAWKAIVEKEGIPFDDSVADKLRGVGRIECVNIILGPRKKEYSNEWKKAFSDFKNEVYVKSLDTISRRNVLPGVLALIEGARAKGIKIAIGSSSKNAKTILTKIALIDTFDAIIDGNDISKSKPDPEVFIKTADKLGILPGSCVVIEDAYAGIEAALAAGMKAFAIGEAVSHKGADGKAKNLSEVSIADLEKLW